MGQPITIYKGTKTAVVYGTAQLEAMKADGWSTEKPKPKPKAKPAAKKKTAGSKGS